MRVLFMGSPEFAVPCLEALNERYQIVAAFTQPDRRAGRGRQIQAPPVKLRASELNIPIFQPNSLKDNQVQGQIKRLSPDVIVVAAYGKILPATLLELPKIACINVHASLLPRWRGAAPVQAAILAGDRVTGISIMKMEESLDTGPIYAQESLDIGARETGGQLTARLANLGADLLQRTLPNIALNKIEPLIQDPAQATYAPQLKKADGALNFGYPASYLARQVRAYEPWPSSYFLWKGNRIVVRQAEAIEIYSSNPGTCLSYHRVPAIAANPGLLLLHCVQPAGKRPMPGEIFLNGAKDFPDGRIDETVETKS